MLFTTDQQTLEDLNIFGRHGSDPVFALFNQTSTRGGEKVLEEWFRYPLSDENAINHRSGIIRHLPLSRLTSLFKTSCSTRWSNTWLIRMSDETCAGTRPAG